MVIALLGPIMKEFAGIRRMAIIDPAFLNMI